MLVVYVPWFVGIFVYCSSGLTLSLRTGVVLGRMNNAFVALVGLV